MKKFIPLLLLILGLVLVPSVHAQFTTVSAQVKDSLGDIYQNCRGEADFVPSPTATTQPFLSGSLFQTSVVISQCDGNGNFTLVLADNNQVSDGHGAGMVSQWRFTICSSVAVANPPICFNYTATITGATQNLTSALSAVAPVLPGKTVPFSSITNGTNTSAAMLVGTGASLAPTGSGTITANSVSAMTFTNLTSGTNTIGAFLIGTGASLGTTGSGTLTATAMPYSGLSSFPAACGANLFSTQIAATPGCTQPAFSNLSGSAVVGQLPLTGTWAFGGTLSGNFNTTGNDTTCIWNSMYVVGSSCYANIAAAAAAADVGLANCSFTTNCGMVYIPPKYAGTDTFNNSGINLLIEDRRSNLFNAPSINVPTFITSIDSDATYPSGRDMNFFAPGPAGLYFRRSTVDTTTAASLSVGANTNVLVGTVNNHNVDLGNVQTGTLLTLFSIGTGAAPQKIFVGRETANNEQLTYSATSNCPTSGTWNIVDGTHLCLNTTKTHAGTTDIEEPPDPVRYDFTDLQIRSYQARPSQDATTCLPLFVNDFNGVDLMTIPSDSTCAAPRNQPAFNSGFNIYVGGGVLSGAPVSTTWESFTLGGPNSSLSNIDQGGTIRGFVGPFYGGTVNNASFGAFRMQNQTYIAQRNAANTDENCFTINATDQWIFSRNCSGGGGALTAATFPIATGTVGLTSNTTTTATQVLHGSATAGVGTWSAIATGDLPTAIPIGNVGSAGLSGTAPVTISAAGAIACATCVTSAASLANGGVVLGTAGTQASATSTQLTFVAPTLTVGLAGTSTGALDLTGATSGNIAITAPAVAGTATNPITISNSLQLPSGTVYNWNADTGLSRDAAGVVDVGTGAAGSKAGTINATTANVTGVSTLGSVSSSTINDANAHAFLASTATASAVDGMTITNAATANPATVTLAGSGTDANINTAFNAKGSGVVQSTGFLTQNANKVVMTADWTCGTGGTVSSCVSATIVGSTGTPMTITLPLQALSWDFDCYGVVSSTTGTPANNWNMITATNGATNVTAGYYMGTAAAVGGFGATTDQASTTTTFSIGGTWTLGAAATKFPFYIHARIEGASASGTVVSLQLVDPTVADLLTIYRGMECWVH